jgi:hypothetical protein
MSNGSGNGEYITATEEEKVRILEQRCLSMYMVTGVVFAACPFCGNMFASERSARRHMMTSRKCLALRGDS